MSRFRSATTIASAALAWGLAVAWTAATPAAATEAATPARPMRLLDNDYYKVHLDIRARIELADFENLQSSQAYTLRTRAGIGSKPIYGLSAYAAVQNTVAIDDGEYFDGVEEPTGQSPIPDPEDTDLNQLLVRYQNAELWNANLTVGRQVIILDDHRFVGNVDWRQNEQVYDAVRASTSLGIERLTLQYAYIDYVSRIFGNQGPPATRNFRSDSHLLHLAYEASPEAKIAAFAYLLEFDNSPVDSSNSFGFRLTGSRAVVPQWSASYLLSYAAQTDAGANPVDYLAHYVAAEAGLTRQETGGVTLGYELLGSDDGDARFVTPLSTAHKFNGWADAFLDNGGPNGLQDLYARVTPKLPLALDGGVIYHQFWSDQGGALLGYEIDGFLQRRFGPYVTVLAKSAYFDGHTATLPDRWRVWMEARLVF